MTLKPSSVATGVHPGAGSNLPAILAIVVSMLIFSLSDAMMKHLGSALPLGQLLVLRGLIAGVLFGLIAAWSGALAHLPVVWSPRVLWRTAAEIACSLLYFLALFKLTLADVAAIGQFAPIAVMAGAALFLGERIGWRRWTAAGVGFLGVLLIVKPGTSAFQPMSLAMLASMLFVAIRDLITRRLPAGTPNILVTWAAIIGVMLAGAVLAPFEVWATPTAWHWLLIGLSGAAVGAGFMLGLTAMRTGDVGVVQPFRYSFMVFGAIAGYVFFGDVPDRISIGGILLIMVSGLYSLHRERVRRREARI